jgi:hypothetical protein
MSRDQNVGENSNMQVGNKSFKIVEQFKYFGTTLTNQNSIHEEIKSRLKSGNACSHSVQNLLFSSLLSKNVKIKMYRIIILPAVLYGCEILSLTFWEERKLRVFKNSVLKRIFASTLYKVTGEWRRLHNKEIYALYSSLNQEDRWAGHVAHVGEKKCIQGFGGEM